MNNLKLNIGPDNSAVILIEFQKTWTEKGIFYNIIKKEYNSRNVLSNTLMLLDTARKKNITVIQAPFIIDKNDKNNYKRNPFLPKLLRRFTKGTWKAEFTNCIFNPNDIVISGRYAFDAAKGSNLEEIIIKNNFTNLLFCGFTTDHCVAETMNPLLSKGYNCILVSDCTAATSKNNQKKMEEKYNSFSSKFIINLINKL